MNKLKPNIIFIHILKCGGTSLRYMLLDEYGYHAIAPVPNGKATGEWDYPYIRNVDPLQHQKSLSAKNYEAKGYQVAMSHYDMRIASQFPEWHIITMLRHPVDQLFSLYKFMRHDDDLKRLHPQMKEQRFENWVVSKNAKPYYNTQTRYLSGHGCENKHIAISWLLNGRFIFGLVERFEDSIALFNEQFDWSLEAKHLNKTPTAPELSSEIFELVEDIQKDDMELYRIACDLFDTQFKDC